jgi:chromosome segregation ATPase
MVGQKELDETVKAVRKAEDENKKIQAKYSEATKDLEGAIKDKNESMIKLYRPRLEKVSKEIADCIQDVEAAISRVNELQQDEEFLEKRFEVVEKLLGGVSKTRSLLTKQLVQCKKLDQAASDALGGLVGDEEDAASEYARLEDIANDLEAKVERIRPLAKKHEDAAKKAITAKNQAALTAARMALLDLEFGKLKLVAQANMPKVKAFLKKYPGNELKANADWLHDKLEALREELEGYDKKTMDLVKFGQLAGKTDLTEAAPAEESKVNLAKAAKVLGIGGKDQAKLAKVLSGRPNTYEKALGGLASELGLDETNGKKLVAMLEKAKVFEA